MYGSIGCTVHLTALHSGGRPRRLHGVVRHQDQSYAPSPMARSHMHGTSAPIPCRNIVTRWSSDGIQKLTCSWYSYVLNVASPLHLDSFRASYIGRPLLRCTHCVQCAVIRTVAARQLGHHCQCAHPSFRSTGQLFYEWDIIDYHGTDIRAASIPYTSLRSLGQRTLVLLPYLHTLSSVRRPHGQAVAATVQSRSVRQLT